MLTNDDLQKMQEFFATKQDLHDLEERLKNELASKEDLRYYSALVEKSLTRSDKWEEEILANRQEHDDIRAEIKVIKSIPVVAHELKRAK